MGRFSGGNSVVHGDFVADVEEAALGGEVYFDLGVRAVSLSEEGGIFPSAGGAGVFIELEGGVGAGRVWIDLFGGLDDGLIGVRFRVLFKGAAARDQQREGGCDDEGEWILHLHGLM